MSSSVTEMKPATSLGSRISLAIRRNIQTYTLIIAVIVIWAIFAITTTGKYLDPQNISNLFRQMSVTSFLSIGMVLVIVTGGIDLSVGKLAGFVSVVVAYLQFYVWFSLVSQPIGAAGHPFRYLRPGGRCLGRSAAGLHHCLPGIAGVHRDPGRHVAVQWPAPAGYPGQDHCGQPGRVFGYCPGLYPGHVGLGDICIDIGVPGMERFQRPARQAEVWF